ncbi:MAG: Chromosome partition protein Smc [Chlamydiae bacterium]|nr:Chromosome partition protein Smc [Chlamydiota bacterium]
MDQNTPLLQPNGSSINSQQYPVETVRRDLKIGLGVGVFGVLVSIATGVVLKVFHIGSEDAPFWIWGFGGGGFTLFTLREGYNIHQERVRIQTQKTETNTRVREVWNIVISKIQNLVPDTKEKATPAETFQALVQTIQTKIQEPKPSDDTQLNQLRQQLKKQTDELETTKRECNDLQRQLSEKEEASQKGQNNENQIQNLTSQLNKAHKDLEKIQQKHQEDLQKATEEIQSQLKAKNQKFRSAEKKLKKLDAQLQEALSTSQTQEEQSKKQIEKLETKLTKARTKYAEAVNGVPQLLSAIKKARKLLGTGGKSSNEPLVEYQLNDNNHPLFSLVKAVNRLTGHVNDLYFESENSVHSTPTTSNSKIDSTLDNSVDLTPNTSVDLTPDTSFESTSNTPNLSPIPSLTNSPKKLVKTRKVVTFDSPGTDAMANAMEKF